MPYGDWPQFKRRAKGPSKRFEVVFAVDGGSQQDWDEWFERHAEHFAKAVREPIPLTKREAVEREARR